MVRLLAPVNDRSSTATSWTSRAIRVIETGQVIIEGNNPSDLRARQVRWPVSSNSHPTPALHVIHVSPILLFLEPLTTIYTTDRSWMHPADLPGTASARNYLYIAISRGQRCGSRFSSLRNLLDPLAAQRSEREFPLWLLKLLRRWPLRLARSINIHLDVVGWSLTHFVFRARSREARSSRTWTGDLVLVGSVDVPIGLCGRQRRRLQGRSTIACSDCRQRCAASPRTAKASFLCSVYTDFLSPQPLKILAGGGPHMGDNI